MGQSRAQGHLSTPKDEDKQPPASTLHKKGRDWYSTPPDEFDCPLPQGSVAVYRTSSTAHWPPGQCGGVPQEFHCPLPQGRGVGDSRSSAATPKQCGSVLVGVPLPTGPGQCSSVPQKLHCPRPSRLPPGSAPL